MTHEELRAHGSEIDAAAYQRLRAFVAALLAENEKVNLTAIRTPDAAWLLHVCDSLALLPLIRGFRPTTILDVGAGGGVPGIPIACVFPALRVTLLDSTAKKIAACRRIVTAIGLSNMHGVAGRAEELAHEPRFRERFDAITARAVAALPTLLEFVAGFVRVGGRCWLFKSEKGAKEEFAAADNAIVRLKLRFVGEHGYDLGDAGGRRVILEFEKVAPLTAEFPREGGQISRKPL